MTDPLDEMIAAYRGWNQLEAGLKSGNQIVDSDLAPPDPKPHEYRARWEVREALKKIFNDLPARHPFLKARVAASLAFISAIEGESLEFHPYIQQTVGIAAERPSESILVKERDRIQGILGIELWNTNAIRRALEQHHASIPEIIATVPQATSAAIRRTADYLDLDLDPPLDIFFAEFGGFWKCWSESRWAKKTRLCFNTAPRHPFLRGDTQLLAFHEIGGHAFQMEMLRGRISSRELHPVYGVTVLHGPEQFVSEGIAQIITDGIFPDQQLSAEVQLAREYERFVLQVYEGAHIDINTGSSIETALRYVRAHIPSEDESTIRSELLERRDDPLLRSYQLVYPTSARYFSTVLRKLGRQSFRSLLRQVYSRPLTVSALNQLVDRWSSENVGQDKELL